MTACLVRTQVIFPVLLILVLVNHYLHHPHISIILVTDEVTPQYKYAFDQLCHQRFNNYEVVVVCSDDMKIKVKDHRTRLRTVPVGTPSIHMFRVGIEMARGRYIHWWDIGESFVDDTNLQSIYNYLHHYNTDVIQLTEHHRFWKCTDESILVRELSKQNLFTSNHFFFSRKVGQRLAIDLRLVGDLDPYTVLPMFLSLRSNSYTILAVGQDIFGSGEKPSFRAVQRGLALIKKTFEYIQSCLLSNHSQETMVLYTQLRKATLKRYLTFMFELPVSNGSVTFDSILTVFSSVETVSMLEQITPNEGELADRVKSARILQIVPHKIRTIGMFYERYSHGGTERVMSLQIQLFLKMQYKVVLFTEKIDQKTEYPLNKAVRRVLLPSTYKAGRAEVLRNALQKEQIDIFIHHSHLSHNLLYDLLVVKTQNVLAVVYRHMVIIMSILMDDSRLSFLHRIFRVADLTIVISHMEEAYLQAMGVSTCYLPNPVQFRDIKIDYQNNRGIILWAGRLMDTDKHFTAALTIMRLVVQKRPKAQMVILGEAYRPRTRKYLMNFIQKYSLHKNIHYYGHVEDMSKWYRKARIHLLTSHSECFPMVVLESKAFGIPLVTFSLPYVELLKDGKGMISVPQYDYQGAANAIIRLLDDDELCLNLSKAAVESLEPLKAFSQEKAWRDLFSRLERKANPEKNTPDVVSGKDIQVLLETIFTQYKQYHQNILA